MPRPVLSSSLLLCFSVQRCFFLCGALSKPQALISLHTDKAQGAEQKDGSSMCIYRCNWPPLCPCQFPVCWYSLTGSMLSFRSLLSLPVLLYVLKLFVCMPLVDVAQSGLTRVLCARSWLWRRKLFISHHMAMSPWGHTHHGRDIVLPSDWTLLRRLSIHSECWEWSWNDEVYREARLDIDCGLQPVLFIPPQSALAVSW